MLGQGIFGIIGYIPKKEPTQGIEYFINENSIGVDFANKYIGGGSLGYGNVQEEIIFAVHPEAYFSQVLFQAMKDNESIYFQGIYKYALHKGYGYGFRFDKCNKINIKDSNSYGRYTGIDALRFDGGSQLRYNDQYTRQCIDREIVKSCCGFTQSPYESIERKNIQNPSQIITGNWGCGIFQGDVQLKFLIQWISCSLQKRDMVYCAFNNKELLNNIEQVVNTIKKMGIRQAYYLIKGYQKVIDGKIRIFEYILQQNDQ